MTKKRLVKEHKSKWFQTTIGEFVEAVYESALEEYMDEIMARRITMQMLLRKLRLQHKLTQEEPKAQSSKKAVLRSELKRQRHNRG